MGRRQAGRRERDDAGLEITDVQVEDDVPEPGWVDVFFTVFLEANAQGQRTEKVEHVVRHDLEEAMPRGRWRLNRIDRSGCPEVLGKGDVGELVFVVEGMAPGDRVDDAVRGFDEPAEWLEGVVV